MNVSLDQAKNKEVYVHEELGQLKNAYESLGDES